MSIILKTRLFFESSFIHHLSIKNFNIFLLVKKSSMKFDQMTFGRYLSNAICAWNNWLETWWNCLLLFIMYLWQQHIIEEIALLISSSYSSHTKYMQNYLLWIDIAAYLAAISLRNWLLIFWRKANIPIDMVRIQIILCKIVSYITIQYLCSVI